MNKIRKMVVMLIAIIVVGASLLMGGSNVYAANNQDALALGFAVDTSKYSNFSRVCEKVSNAYVTDEANTSRVCGTVTVQSLFATNKEKYLINKQQDVWLTRTITCGAKVKYVKYSYEFIKSTINVSFGTSSVVENTPMPSGVNLASYIATSPSQMVNKTVSSGWSYNGSAGYTGKYISIGASSGVSWSSTTKQLLCSAYNESRTTGFKVSFSLLDPYYNSMTEREKSFCYGMNYFYTAKHVYGAPEVMARVQEKINVTVTFKGNYTKPVPDGTIMLIPAYGTAKVSVLNSSYY